MNTGKRQCLSLHVVLMNVSVLWLQWKNAKSKIQGFHTEIMQSKPHTSSDPFCLQLPWICIWDELFMPVCYFYVVFWHNETYNRFLLLQTILLCFYLFPLTDFAGQVFLMLRQLPPTQSRTSITHLICQAGTHLERTIFPSWQRRSCWTENLTC